MNTEITKNRTHLTPEEVQEFISLGVDFGETADIWIKVGKRWDRRSREFQSEIDDMLPDVEAGLGFNLQKNAVLPCPNLQEVFEILPKTIIHTFGSKHYPHGKDVICPIDIEYTTDGLCLDYAAKLLASDGCFYMESVMVFFICNTNPLIAVTDLLRWVCQNHPETLAKTE